MIATPSGISVYRWSSPVFANPHSLEKARSFQHHHHQERFGAIIANSTLRFCKKRKRLPVSLSAQLLFKMLLEPGLTKN